MGSTPRLPLSYKPSASIAALAVFCLLMTPRALGASTPEQAAGGDPQLVQRVYHIQYLDPQEAWILAHSQCSPTCDTQHFSGTYYAGKSFFDIATTEEIHRKIAAVLKERDVPSPTQVFRVYLLQTVDKNSPSDVFPREIESALDDLRKLLPLERFKLLDSGWMRTSHEASVAVGGEQGYLVQLSFKGDPASGKPLLVDRFEVLRRYFDKQTIAERSLMSTSFGISPGETLVLGTSKLDSSGQAIVVLLTAVK